MRIYLADTNNTNHRAANHYLTKQGYDHNVLMSFYYYDDKDMDALLGTFDRMPNLFVDSGAFSAWSLGKKEITVHGYGDWLLKNQHLFPIYASLDEKRYTPEQNAQVGLDNLRILEGMGLKPIPVFHAGEPWSLLDDLMTDYPYIALGGTAGHTQHGGDLHWRFTAECFRRAQGRDVVFHGFGVTTWRIIKAFPWYSVDSSSWGQSFRYGVLSIFDPITGSWHKARPRHHRDMAKLATQLKRLGFDWMQLLEVGKQRPNRKMLCGVAATSYMIAAEWIERRHGKVVIPARNGAHSP